MYKIEIATKNDVDTILDMKLDIIFNTEESKNFNREEMEKIVNYAEENIRNEIENYRKIYLDNEFTGVYALTDYEDGMLLDTIYIKEFSRNKGIGTNIIDKILKTNYKPIYLWVYKSNKNAIKLYKKMQFEIAEETETRYLMKNKNEKQENAIIKARLFCEEVRSISKKYDLEYFFVTEGASSTHVQKNEAVRKARENHIKWEKENGEDPSENWSEI